jgi:hypothetical protein
MPSRENRPQVKPGGGPNNVYSDRQGNVYRDTPNGWQQNKGGNQWQKPTNVRPTPSARPAPGAAGARPSARPAPPGVGGYAQARDRAAARPSGGYAGGMSRPAPKPRPSGGGARPAPRPSGGGRKR